MAKWQPPIPAGALWSRPARDLGPAVALLAYCYDCVQGDGSLELNLHEVAGDMSEPYPTVKRWWAMLRSGPFFAKVIERGRNGMVAKFAEDWIDRRALEKREQKTVSQVIPITPTPTPDTGSEMISNDVNGTQSAPNRDVIGTETGSLLNAPYIGTHDTQRDSDHAAKAAPKKRALKSPETTQAELIETPLSIYRQVTNLRSPNQAQRELIETVEDVDLWRATCEQFALSGWNMRNVPNMVENYAKRLADKKRRSAPASYQANGHSNGYGPPHIAPDDEGGFISKEEADRFIAQHRGGFGR